MSVAQILVSGGFGAGLAAIIVALIQNSGSKSQAKAEAAELITKAAGELVDRLQKENIRMRTAILLLTDVLDDIIDDIDVDPAVKTKLRQVNKQAKEAV